MDTRRDLRGALIGMVLGDGALYRNKLRGQPVGHYKLDLAHSEKQLEYLRHKVARVQPLFDYELPIVPKPTFNKRTGKTYQAYICRTRVHPRLTFVAERMYQPLKRISEWALDNITDEGVAYWWMDDGCLHQRMARQRDGVGEYPVSIAILGTYGFLKQDVERLARWMEDRYGVSWNINQHIKGGLSLRLGGKRAQPFLDRIKPFSVPSMAYKFSTELSTVPGPSLEGDDIVRSR